MKFQEMNNPTVSVAQVQVGEIFKCIIPTFSTNSLRGWENHYLMKIAKAIKPYHESGTYEEIRVLDLATGAYYGVGEFYNYSARLYDAEMQLTAR